MYIFVTGKCIIVLWIPYQSLQRTTPSPLLNKGDFSVNKDTIKLYLTNVKTQTINE